MLLLLPTCVVSPCACLWPQVSQGWLSLRRASKGALRAALACTFSPAPCTCASVYPHASCLCASSLRLTHSPLNQPDLVLGSSLAAARASPHRAFACPARPRALSRLFVCARCGVCPAACRVPASCVLCLHRAFVRRLGPRRRRQAYPLRVLDGACARVFPPPKLSLPTRGAPLRASPRAAPRMPPRAASRE